MDQGSQSPFISAAKRSITGRRYSATWAAQRSISASWSPEAIRASAYSGWSGPPRHESQGSQEIRGTAPRRLIASASSRGKSGVCAQSANVPTIAARAPIADSASSSAASEGTFMPKSVCPRALVVAFDGAVWAAPVTQMRMTSANAGTTSSVRTAEAILSGSAYRTRDAT